MAEAMADQFDAGLVETYVHQLRGPGFDAATFRTAVGRLDGLPLKERVARFADALAAALPEPFPAATALLAQRLPPPLPDTSEVASTFHWWPLCSFVERHGLDHPDVSLPLLRRLTRTFSAEFAVRPFLDADPEGTLAFLADCLDDADPHVRRWVSEGTRPRLPWGRQLRHFVQDPSHTLPLLDRLVDDPEGYVRRSVANHLGDVAKDHPDHAVQVARRWVGDGAVPPRGGTDRQALVRHGLRHLVKQGHTGALDLMGYGSPQVDASLTASERLVLGGALEVQAVLTNLTDEPQPLLVDVGVCFLGADGSLRAPKVFKWTTVQLDPRGGCAIDKRLPLRAVTTRTHHEGRQGLVLRVNGHDVAEASFQLDVPS